MTNSLAANSHDNAIALIDSQMVQTALELVRDVVDYAKLRENLASQISELLLRYENVSASQDREIFDRDLDRIFAKELTSSLIAAGEHAHAVDVFRKFMEMAPRLTRDMSDFILNQSK